MISRKLAINNYTSGVASECISYHTDIENKPIYGFENSIKRIKETRQSKENMKKELEIKYSG